MLLALDTATDTLSIALHDGESLVAECSLRAERRHNTLLAPMIRRLMADSQVDMSSLSALAVAVGPGSYTGTRIGVALAKGMAGALDLPLAPVSTLDIVAASASPGHADRSLVATVSAGRRRVIWSHHRWDGGAWVACGGPRIGAWSELIAACAGAVDIHGEISPAGMAAIESAGCDIRAARSAQRLRRAGFLAEIAWTRLRGRDASDAFEAADVMPIYLKGPG